MGNRLWSILDHGLYLFAGLVLGAAVFFDWNIEIRTRHVCAGETVDKVFLKTSIRKL